jgi:hypothetical protein
MNKKSGFLVLMLILALAVSAFSQDDDEKWRSFEVVAFGGLSLPSGSLSDWNDTLGAEMGFNLGLASGYYFTEKICAGIYFDYTQFGVEDYSLNYRLYNAGVYGKYSFVGESNFEPYVKVSAGGVWPKFATWIGPDKNVLRELSYDPALNLGLHVGALYYTADFGGIFLELGYQMDMLKDAKGDYGGEEFKLADNVNYINIRAGVNVFFGPE